MGKALPRRKDHWKARGPSHGGTELSNTGQLEERGAGGAIPSLNSLSTSTGRWPIMAARRRADYPELGGIGRTFWREEQRRKRCLLRTDTETC